MNHAYVEEQQIVERYVLGQLPPEEAASFEEHYLGCAECLDRLELAESMERGFKRAAGQDAVRLAAARRFAFLAWFSRLGRSRQMGALLMGLFALLAVPGVLTFRQFDKLDRELAQARWALAQERERAAAGGSSHELDAEKLRAELRASRGDLTREREARSRAEEQLAEAQRPQSNFPILLLDPERDASPAAAPTFRVRLPRPPGGIVFRLELDPPYQPSYRAVLRDSRGREVWRGDLRLNGMEILSLRLPSDMLAPGDYTLAVEGLVPGGKPVAAGRYPFRVLPAA